MKEKTQGERTAWGAAALVWAIAGFGATYFIPAMPLWGSIAIGLAWVVVLVLILDKSGMFSSV